MLGISALVQGASVAEAAELPANSISNLTVTKTSGWQHPNDAAIYVWDSVELSGNWSVPNNSNHSGDHFKVALPESLRGIAGSFELDGADGTSYGTCVVDTTTMTCTLNDNVNGKVNVGGMFKLNMQAHRTSNTSNLTFLINDNTPINIPLPNGASGIGYAPYVPQDIAKLGFFNDDLTALTWRLRIPGSALQGTSTLKIDDPFAVAGTTYNYVADSATLRAIKATPYCFNEDWQADCNVPLNSNPVINVDDANDHVTAFYNNQAPFSADVIYLFEFTAKIGEEVLVGAEFPNTATVNGTAYSETVTREASGSGTGSGENTVGHIELTKKVEGNGTVPQDTSYQVTYSYMFKGAERTGTLTVTADGKARLNNVPHGTVVTLTEQLPNVAGVTFGDPSFAGDAVTDGGDNNATATITVEGTKLRKVTLTNPTTPNKPKVVPQDPTVAAGVCPADSTTPTEPTVNYAVTQGIDYSHTIAQAGDQVVVTVVATPTGDNEIDTNNLPAGWSVEGDKVVYKVTLDVPKCVVPVAPVIEVGTCPAGSLTPTDPTVTFADVTGLNVVSNHEVVGGVIKVTATATPEAGYAIGGPLPEGWTLQPDGTAKYAGEKAQPACEATKVVPVNPVVSAGVCPADSTTPTAPEVTPATTTGLTYEVAESGVTDGVFNYTVVAKPASEGYVIDGAALPEGWTLNADGSATYKGSVDVPKCVVPVVPVIEAGVCPADSTTPTEPKVTFAEVAGLKVEAKHEVVDGKVVVNATATLEAGYQFGGPLPEGWTLNDDRTVATYNGSVDQPRCAELVAPVIDYGVCELGSTTPTEPKITVAPVDGIDFSDVKITETDGKLVATATATPQAGYQIGGTLPEGWTLNADGTASFRVEGTATACVELVAPVIDAGTCQVGSLTPTEPSVKLTEVAGLEFVSAVEVVDGKVVVTATATPKAGYQIGGALPEGWKLNADGTASFRAEVDQPVCQPTPVTPVSPKITPGVCKPGSSKPTDPTVEVPSVPGLDYGIPSIKTSGGKVTITVKVTPKTAYTIGKDDLPKGWVVNEDGSATFTYSAKVPSCGKPGLPKTGD